MAARQRHVDDENIDIGLHRDDGAHLLAVAGGEEMIALVGQNVREEVAHVVVVLTTSTLQIRATAPCLRFLAGK